MIIIDPEGREHDVLNLGAFCREHGLDRANMHHVTEGSRRHHRGYTCPGAGYVRIYRGMPCKPIKHHH